MLFIPFLLFSAGAVVGCPGSDHKDRRFLAPLPTDRRSPCPALNALANHGYLPRDGADVSLDEFLDSIDEVFNVDPSLIQPLVEAGLVFSTTGMNETLNLDDLDHQADPREHDGSLSRSDLFLGDNHSFNATIWNQVSRHFRNKTITIETAELARRDRIAAARAANPQFNFGDDQNGASLGESAFYLKVFEVAPGKTSHVWTEVLFREERLPWEEGYKRPKKQIIGDDIVAIVTAMSAVP
ncbi:Cloroperoxidase [Thozetella sp. PMI_491]|nr:Cloroperoxidase [Thozetella sp. PMI_491]